MLSECSVLQLYVHGRVLLQRFGPFKICFAFLKKRIGLSVPHRRKKIPAMLKSPAGCTNPLRILLGFTPVQRPSVIGDNRLPPTHTSRLSGAARAAVKRSSFLRRI